MLFVSIFCASYHALPLNEDKIRKPEDLVVFQPVYIVENSDPPQNQERYIKKRQAEYIPSLDDSNEIKDADNDDITLSETRRRYYPYFRIRRIYTSHRDQPIYPASNYADSYDRFPTVA